MADASRLPEGILIEGSLLTARPVDTLVRNTADGLIYASTNAAVPTYTALPAPVASVAQVTSVAKSNGDYTTIAAGLAAAGAVAAANNRQVVLIYPGDYTEANPLTVPDYVSVIAVARHESTRMFCANNGAGLHGLICGSDTDIVGIQVRDASGAGAAAFYMPVGAKDIELHDCKSRDCDIGVLSETGAASEANIVREFSFTGGAGSTGLQAGASSRLDASDVFVTQDVTLTDWTLADGAGARLHITGSTCRGAMITNGFHAKNGGTVEAEACHLDGMDVGVRVAAASTVRTSAVHIDDTITADLVMEATTATVLMGGGTGRTDKMIIPAGTPTSNRVIDFVTDTPGDEGHAFLGELHVGLPGLGAESVLGERDSTTRGMVVLTTDATGAAGYVDETANAVAGTAFTLQGVAAGFSLILLNTDPRKFPGFKDSLSIAAVIGAGGFIVELSDGAGGWLPVACMTVDSNAPYSAHGNQIWERAQSSQVRISHLSAAYLAWATETINGSTGYAMRIRSTGITTAPTFATALGASLKLHTHRTEFNADGFQEYFGSARPLKPLMIHQRLFDDLAGSSPANATIQLTTNVSITPIDNRFNNGVIDGVGMLFTIPPGLDTSFPLTARITWRPATANGGNVEFETNHALLAAGDLVNGTHVDTNTPVVATVAAGTLDIMYQTELSVDIADAVPGQVFVSSLFRDATAGNLDDTLVGNIEIIAIEGFGYGWRP